MLTSDAHIGEISNTVRSGKAGFLEYINEVCDRIDAVEPHIESLIPELERRSRLVHEATDLVERFPEDTDRLLLYGILVGVKDIFRVDGFPTKCGSRLPEELFAGSEATCVTMLRSAGALILGKTVTTEFAYREPGPTRNPHNLQHTPGGSSSGSAAAVAAGLCPLALGTQTVGSVIRPAAYCGVIGFKPTYDRISTSGIIPYSASADHVGIFTQDVEGMRRAASVLCSGWKTISTPDPSPSLPILGVPEGPYLQQASAEMRSAFDDVLLKLADAGYSIKRKPVFEDIAEISALHTHMISAEMAQVHAEWFDKYGTLYRPRTASTINLGRQVDVQEVNRGRKNRHVLRARLAKIMDEEKINVWVSPAATETAPQGLESTGDPAMNLPWTHAGVPTITIPFGFDRNGVPCGLQVAAKYMEDAMLLTWSAELEETLRPVQKSAVSGICPSERH